MTLEDAWPAIIEASRPHEEVRENPTNYASQVWKAFSCLRRAYWDRVDPIDGDGSWFVTAQHGVVVGQLVADFFKRAGIWRGDEVRGGDKRFNLSYRIDILAADGIRYDESAELIVPVEVKSVKGKKWEWMLKEGGNKAHKLQLQCYIHFHKPKPYPHGYLLYFNRDTDEVKLIKIKHDPLIGKQIEEVLDELEFAVETGNLPDKIDNDYDCKFCEYKDRCKGVG